MALSAMRGAARLEARSSKPLGRTSMDRRIARWLGLIVIGWTATVAAPAAADVEAPGPAVPIQATGPTPRLPAFIRAPAQAPPAAGVRSRRQNPYLACAPRNSVHGDAWQSDNYPQCSGPLGHRLQTLSTAIDRDC